MSLVAEILSGFIHKNQRDLNVRANFIFYKIVDSFKENQTYLLQCINTKATFQSNINEIVFDTDILYGLHPIQACYVGIEYSKHIKNTFLSAEKQQKQKEKIGKLSVCRYGKYNLCSQNRDGKLCFVSKTNGECFTMDPRDIALSEELINEFDASQAFFIGLNAGLKLNGPATKQSKQKTMNAPQLRIVE